jgi:hypothetical protein
VIISNIVKVLLTLLCIFGGISPGVETKGKSTIRVDGMKELTAVENFVSVFAYLIT